MGAKMLVVIMVVISICYIPNTYATPGNASDLIPTTNGADVVFMACPTTDGQNEANYTYVNSDLWNDGQSCGQTYSLTCDPSQNPTETCTTDTLEVVIDGGCLVTDCPTFLLSSEEFAVIANTEDPIVNVDYTPIPPS